MAVLSLVYICRMAGTSSYIFCGCVPQDWTISAGDFPKGRAILPAYFARTTGQPERTRRGQSCGPPRAHPVFRKISKEIRNAGRSASLDEICRNAASAGTPPLCGTTGQPERTMRGQSCGAAPPGAPRFPENIRERYETPSAGTPPPWDHRPARAHYARPMLWGRPPRRTPVSGKYPRSPRRYPAVAGKHPGNITRVAGKYPNPTPGRRKNLARDTRVDGK